jgi:predicted RecA/RadA family phage recombinase
MPKAQYIHEGTVVDFTPGVDVAAGSVVVQGDLVGITKRDVKANTLGGLAVEGVFDIVKASADAITAGAKVYWKADDETVVTVASGNKLVGKAIATAGAGTTTVRVLMAH